MTRKEAAKRYRIIPTSFGWQVQMWLKVYWYTLEEFESVESANEYMQSKVEETFMRCNNTN